MAGREVEDDEGDRLDEDKLEALMEADLDREASDEQEIEDLEGNIDIKLMVEDIALGKSGHPVCPSCQVEETRCSCHPSCSQG